MSGEAIPYRDVAVWGQGTTTVLFGRAYSDVDRDFKVAAQEFRGAELVIIGSSRVMYTRKEFFRPEVSFYNAGGAARWPEGLEYFLASLPKNKKPRVIVVGLDQRWFMSDFLGEETDLFIHEDAAWSQFFGYAWKRIYIDYLAGKFSLRDILRDRTSGHFVGLNARARNNGFRNDGSYRSGQFLGDPGSVNKVAADIKGIIERIDQSTYDFDYTDELNNKSLKAIEEFLAVCKNENIEVIGYLSPYPAGIYEKISQAAGTAQKSRDRLENTLQSLFKAHKFTFYDLSNPRIFDGKDEEFIDAWHGSDKTFARLYLWLSEKNGTLGRLVDRSVLKKALQNSRDTYQVFND